MVKLSSLSCYNVSMLAFPAQYARRASCMYPNYVHFGVRCKKMNLNTRKSSWAHRDKSDYCTRLYDNEFSWTIPFPGCGCKKTRENGEGNVFVVQSRNSSRGDSNEDHRGSRNCRFALRLRPRMRLLSSKLRRVSSFHQIRETVGKNLKVVILSFVATTVFSLCCVFLRMTSAPSPKVVPYSDLIMDLQAGYVTKVLFEEGSRRIFFNIKKEPKQDLAPSIVVNTVTDELLQCSISSSDAKEVGEEERTLEVDSSAAGSDGVLRKIGRWRFIPRSKVSSPQWQLSTRKIDHDENFLLGLMREKGTIYSSAPQSVLMSMRSVLLTILSLWIPLAPLMWLLYRQLSAANSPAKKRKSQNQTANFDDVEGVDAAKLELMEIVSCLQGSTNYQKLGAKLPRGVLLVGPPGTGKTLLARAVAGEAGVPFFSVSASEFVELFVGRGAARIRDLFNTARKSAPSIIFIDELDAVGGRRGRSFNDERDQTLNQLLTEMDGFESDMSAIVIAATNRPEALDPALCRPGRFSRKVYVGAPDVQGRQKIASVHLRRVPLEENLDVISNLVASLTNGLVGADIANITNEAALLAARRGGEVVTREDVMEAIERARFGINERPVSGGTIRKELERWLSWMPMVTKGTNSRDSEQPLGYQTLSS